MLEFAGRFSRPELLVKDFKYWAVVFKENPSVLGQVAFVLKNETPDFSHVKPAEMAEFPKVCKWFETKIKGLYGAEKFNYSAIMMKEHFVHFNVCPRYSGVVDMYGMKWVDEGWPKKMVDAKIDIPADVQSQIISDLKD